MCIMGDDEVLTGEIVEINGRQLVPASNGVLRDPVTGRIVAHPPGNSTTTIRSPQQATAIARERWSEYHTAAQFAADYEKWQTVKTNKAELDEYETISQQADATEKELLREKTELMLSVIPDNTRGIERVFDEEFDAGLSDVPPCFYVNGYTSMPLAIS